MSLSISTSMLLHVSTSKIDKRDIAYALGVDEEDNHFYTSENIAGLFEDGEIEPKLYLELPNGKKARVYLGATEVSNMEIEQHTKKENEDKSLIKQ